MSDQHSVFNWDLMFESDMLGSFYVGIRNQKKCSIFRTAVSIVGVV